jgi:hypothetical protein
MAAIDPFDFAQGRLSIAIPHLQTEVTALSPQASCLQTSEQPDRFAVVLGISPGRWWHAVDDVSCARVISPTLTL